MPVVGLPRFLALPEANHLTQGTHCRGHRWPCTHTWKYKTTKTHSSRLPSSTHLPPSSSIGSASWQRLVSPAPHCLPTRITKPHRSLASCPPFHGTHPTPVTALQSGELVIDTWDRRHSSSLTPLNTLSILIPRQGGRTYLSRCVWRCHTANPPGRGSPARSAAQATTCRRTCPRYSLLLGGTKCSELWQRA